MDFYRRSSMSSPAEKRPPPPVPPKPTGLSPSGYGGRNEPSPPPYQASPGAPALAPAPSGLYPQDIKVDPSRRQSQSQAQAQADAAGRAAKVDQMLAEQNAALGLPPPPPRNTSPLAISPSQSQQGPGSTSEPTSGTSTPRKRPLLNRLLLAGEVVLTSLEATAHNLIDSGTSAASSAAGHKFGPEAGHATHLIGGSVRNVAVVYIDARGIGRKALLKGTAKGFVKARLKSGETVQLQGGDTAVAVPAEAVAASSASASASAGQAQAGSQLVQVEAGEAERKGDNMVVVGMPQVGGGGAATQGGPFSAGPSPGFGGFGNGNNAGQLGGRSSGYTSAPVSAASPTQRRNMPPALPPSYIDKDTLDMIDRH